MASEQIGDAFSTRVARADLERLLGMEPDDAEVYVDEADGAEDEEMDDYVPDFENGDYDEGVPAPDEARGERRELVRDDQNGSEPRVQDTTLTPP